MDWLGFLGQSPLGGSGLPSGHLGPGVVVVVTDGLVVVVVSDGGCVVGGCVVGGGVVGGIVTPGGSDGAGGTGTETGGIPGIFGRAG